MKPRRLSSPDTNRRQSAAGPSLACHGRQLKGWAAAVADAQWTRIEAAGFHPLDHGVRHDRHGESEARARTRVHAPAFRPNRARRYSLQVDAQATELRFLRRHRNPSQPVTARPARSPRLPDQQTASGKIPHGRRPLRKHQMNCAAGPSCACPHPGKIVRCDRTASQIEDFRHRREIGLAFIGAPAPYRFPAHAEACTKMRVWSFCGD